MPFATLSRNAVEPPVAHVAPDDPFAVISTAAVDVIPRGAALTHANVITANLTAMACIGYSAADRYLLALPLFHITALGMAMAHMHAGGASVVVSRLDAEEAVRLIDRHRVTHVSDFPPVLSALLDAAEKLGSRLPSLKHVSGLGSPQTIQRLHEETRAQFWTGFGQSETSGFVTLQRVLDKPGAAGKPVPLCQVKLVDEYDREVPVGAPGEIVVRGPLVFQGYFGQPDVTAYALRNGWHHTGDVGRFDADGYLYYVRRKPEKELIKPGGENVYPAEVETVIMKMDGVSGVCVYGIPDAKWGEAIKAVGEGKAAGRYTAQQGSDFVASKIARFQKPPAGAVTDAAAVAAMVERVVARWGTVHILVNNAGWDRPIPFVETTPDFWDRILAINLRGPIACTHAVLPHMIRQAYGKIVSIASDAGRVGSTGEAVYSAAKGGIIAFTKTIAREVARHRINVNCVCPGPSETPLFQAEFVAKSPKLAESLKRVIPWGRLGTPEDVAPAVVFLASDEAGFITGQTLSVSGGLTMI